MLRASGNGGEARFVDPDRFAAAVRVDGADEPLIESRTEVSFESDLRRRPRFRIGMERNDVEEAAAPSFSAYVLDP